LTLYCDQRKYAMMKLTTSSKGRLPEDMIYSHGANIVPISCSKYRETENLHYATHLALSPISIPAQVTPPTIPTTEMNPPIIPVQMSLDDLPPGPSFVVNPAHSLPNEEYKVLYGDQIGR
jgi:hypothetical protein